MSCATRFTRKLATTTAIACVLTLVSAVALWWLFANPNTVRLIAYFDNAIGVYAGSDVRVLGVPIGTVADIVPEGTQVRLDMLVNRNIRIPADSDAVMIAPSVISDRYVQLAPAYTAGPTMSDGAVIPRARTATPVELDQLYHSVNQLATDLGPNGANRDGALNDLLTTMAANLAGNGQNLHDTIANLAQLAATLHTNQDKLFATVDNLTRFTTALAGSDATIRTLTRQLVDVTGFLATQRHELAAAVGQLATALGSVATFVHTNRSAIDSTVHNLSGITQVLADERSALAETLDDAPLAIDNGINTYNAASGTIDGRPDINELSDPPIVELCRLLRQTVPTGPPAPVADVCRTLAPVESGRTPLPTPAQVIGAWEHGSAPPLPLPAIDVAYGMPGPAPVGAGHARVQWQSAW